MRRGFKEGEPNPQQRTDAVEDDAVTLALEKSPIGWQVSCQDQNRTNRIRGASPECDQTGEPSPAGAEGYESSPTIGQSQCERRRFMRAYCGKDEE